MSRLRMLVLTISLVGLCAVGFAQEKKRMTEAEKVDFALTNAQSLKFPRGERLPLFFWHLRATKSDDEQEIEATLKALDTRGLPVVTVWTTAAKAKPAAMERAVRIARAQNKLGLVATAFAGNTGNGFYADKATWHVDEKGEPFADTSHGKSQLGCPFEKGGWPTVEGQLREWVKAYKDGGARLDGVWFDWENTGPAEWNDAWAMSRRCVKCQKALDPKGLKDFATFQKAMREIRSAMQKIFVDVIHESFPKANVANYGVYPQGPYRYWWDYYEKLPAGAPFQADQRARYRPWVNEFPLTGFTIGMPVVYGWGGIFSDYDYADTDYRWFYNMLLVFSDSAQHRPAGVPLVPFVNRWVKLPDTSPDAVPLSEEKYKELLWHIFLRGADGLYIWCADADIARELIPVHSVYAAALEYREFLTNGKPITFDVPAKQGPVVSGLKLGNKLLVRRTDFGPEPLKDVTISVEGGTFTVTPLASGRTVVLSGPSSMKREPVSQ